MIYKLFRFVPKDLIYGIGKNLCNAFPRRSPRHIICLSLKSYNDLKLPSSHVDNPPEDRKDEVKRKTASSTRFRFLFEINSLCMQFF